MRHAALALLMIVAVAAVCQAKVVKGFRTVPAVAAAPARDDAKGGLVLRIDSIDFRKDLTRVYCHVAGKPHPAHRIDAVTLTAGTRAMGATDIDGIELKQYFQFEDDGTIALEIDFPATATARKGSVTIVTPQGALTYSFR